MTNELARVCAELSFEIRRQIGLLIDRRGHVQSVIIGNDHELVIPNMARSRSGLRLLRGVRLVHTHLNNEPLSRDDLTDLALLRLDLMIALGIGQRGNVQDIYLAHLLPHMISGKSYHIWDPCPWQRFDLDCQNFIQSLESDRTQAHVGLRRGQSISSAILVSVSTERASRRQEHLDELRELVRASHINVVDVVVQRPQVLHPKYVLGLGKLKEVIIQALQTGADWLIFDRDLTPAQVHGISQMTELRVLDRTQVILDIFAQRAHSRIGKVQVELAQLRYRLPRLAQTNTAFSRLAGGIGSRGPGETKLETDRRRARDRIRRLEKELESVSRSRDQQRNMRNRQNIPVISVIGYTNVGKTTLLNALTGSRKSARDRVFETLDPVSRRLYIPGRGEVIVTDTVGFIRELPEDLVAAFQTTLQELEYADVLLHVVDVSASDLGYQIQAVENILRQLGFEHIPRLMVLNKCDILPSEQVERLCHRYRAIGITATQGQTLGVVREALLYMLNRLEQEGKVKRMSQPQFVTQAVNTSVLSAS